ncbi:Chemotaxis protein CheA [Polystyrenella longa]|uniref:histidine kinase n=1 Tax=Polystyrenella longa TaxID=2528007 RepID=A0A518CGQ9_9PLAN|nr:hybrid sensor histidine kinase/response regulator [Polystyrenella longa]QDU78421.1 Chemotaxis protein CheA [Polystyrenella longa]
MEDEIIQEFLAESWENLVRLDTEIVSLEQNPEDPDLIGSIFRTIHTIKGTCGFIGLNRTGELAHATENVLGKMRDKKLPISESSISIVLKGIDGIKELLQSLEATGQESTTDYNPLIKELDALSDSVEDSGAAVPGLNQLPTSSMDMQSESAANSFSNPFDEAMAPAPEPEPATPAPQASVSAAPPVLEAEVAPPAPAPKPAEQTEPVEGVARKSVADLSIRVNVDVLDSLMNLVGELVLTRNQLLQLARTEEESKYSHSISHLNRVTTDLQEGVMKTRMQPIGNAWSKLPRLVRDLCQITGRHIDLEMSGSETELDRTVLDAIKDPLTHMVRNSADHGIELPEVRRDSGKPETGTINLNAYHEGGHVIISIEDDGAGINTDRVLQKAIQNELVTEAEAAKMTQSEILPMIFHPGFSTAEKVSSVSGRGVGMDVVKTAIEQIGGTVDLATNLGKGTTVRIKIPLTLAIISALVVESGGECFAIPQLGVVELVRLEAEDRQKIERIHQHEVFRLRDRLLPLVYLSDTLELDRALTDEDDIYIVVVQVGENQLGLIVSEVFDTEEIVVKPMGSLLKDVAIYQGTTILGDGRVIMILDVAGIASEFNGLQKSPQDHSNAENEFDQSNDTTSLLLFDPGNQTTMAVPLSLVARLEEFPRESIERSGNRLIVQYRGDLLPLQPVSEMDILEKGPDPQPVIVFSEGDCSMGLLVNEIKDILNERLDIRMQSQREGVLGTAIVNNCATDIIDTQYYISSIVPHWYDRATDHKKLDILVVDDSLFFRQLVTTALESNGYRVNTQSSAVNAIEMIEHGERFDFIISDIEMPVMDGFAFAKWVRGRSDMSTIPMIAMTSLSAKSDEQYAEQMGFNRFLKKFNAKQLIDTIEEIVRSRAISESGARAS